MLSRLRHYYRMSNIAGALGIASAALAKMTGVERTIEVSHPLLRVPFSVRVPSSDISVAEQILVAEEYRFAVRFAPSTIIDAGANIGLAAVYFKTRFFLARIIGAELFTFNMRALASAGQKIILQCELSDLGVQFLHGQRRRRSRIAESAPNRLSSRSSNWFFQSTM